jgi:hypothetical protein
VGRSCTKGDREAPSEEFTEVDFVFELELLQLPRGLSVVSSLVPLCVRLSRGEPVHHPISYRHLSRRGDIKRIR